MSRHSATLAINERVHTLRAAGESVLHLGFGEAGLPVPPEVAAVLAESVLANGYPPVRGDLDARAAAAGYFDRRGLPTGPDQVILAPGSKPLLFALLAALPGDVLLPQPCWLSYAAQAELAGKRVLGVPAVGGVPDPARLAEALRGVEGGVLLLTQPDNPTGLVAPRAVVAEVCALAERHGLTIVSDEIYRDLASDPITSPAEFLPERTVITTGLSKNLALGGYRIGFARILDAGLMSEVAAIAGTAWSVMAAPMQRVAAYALAEPEPVTAHIAASRALHLAVGAAVHEIFVAAGASCPPPRAAVYLYPDFACLKPEISSAAELARILLENHGIAVLPGSEFGDDPAELRFRVATSLLYGQTDEQRWAALRSPEPAELPWIRAALDQLRAGLTALRG